MSERIDAGKRTLTWRWLRTTYDENTREIARLKAELSAATARMEKMERVIEAASELRESHDDLCPKSFARKDPKWAVCDCCGSPEPLLAEAEEHYATAARIRNGMKQESRNG